MPMAYILTRHNDGDAYARSPTMSLRARLVAALAVMLLLGMGAFGLFTYHRQSSSEHQQLDQGLRNALPQASQQLSTKGGVDAGHSNDHDATGGSSGEIVATYKELRDAAGTTKIGDAISDTAVGEIPHIPSQVNQGEFLTVGSVSGDTRWRVWADQGGRNREYTVIVATPTTGVSKRLKQLVVTEIFAGLAILVLLTGGAWLILRRGLRPLERMADTAGSISAGDLSLRVAPADGRGEVGQLGLALNSMLGEIESAFAARAATEDRLRQFLADAAHELRTPLTSIRGFAELFRLGVESEHVDRGVIMRRIEEESTRMKVLVDDLLLLARLDQTRPIERTPVDIVVLAADACSDAVAADPARPVTLNVPESLVVVGDRGHLHQAITNLVTNARKHTPPGTAIDISAHRQGLTAVVTVSDHGTGLDDEAMAHVFDRFWQADKARVGAGFGLGLSIVAGVAAEHHGSVAVANAPNGGAVFTLELPLAP